MNMVSRLQIRQLIVLLLVTIPVLVFTAIHYVHIDSAAGLGRYIVTANFADSGGIFSNAEVTYQGIPVGRVRSLRLTSAGVAVDLELGSSGPKIPAGATAVVANRSAIGEQYVDLRPHDSAAPYLADGSVIDSTAVPVPLESLIKSSVSLADSIPINDVHTVVTELGKAFNGRGEDLRTLVGSLSRLSKAGFDNLPATISLIRNSDAVLVTQAEQSDAIGDWARDLEVVTAQLQASDPDLRRLLTTGSASATQISALVRDSGKDLTTVARDLATDVRAVSPTFFGVRPLLMMLSGLSAGAHSVAPGDGTIHFGVVLETNNPPGCTAGYEGTQRIIDNIRKNNPRFDISYDDFPFNTAADCAVAHGNPTDVRGSRSAVYANPAYSQPWDDTPKKAPDALNLNPLATQLSGLLGVRPVSAAP